VLQLTGNSRTVPILQRYDGGPNIIAALLLEVLALSLIGLFAESARLAVTFLWRKPPLEARSWTMRDD
jgi:hypothetical protein